MIENLKNVRLETERLLLREHAPEDAAAMEAFTPREEYWRFLRAGRLGLGSATEFIERVLPEAEQTSRIEYNLAVLVKAQATRENGGLIGSFRLGFIDHDNRGAMLGYALDPEHWGQGYATEAAGRLIRFGFDDLGLHRIHASCDVENHTSYRLMEKLGMTREGLLRENHCFEGEWRSSYLYAILASD